MRNDYSKNYFWKKKDPKTGKTRYYLNPKGNLVEVDSDVFKVCYNSYTKMYRDDKRDEKFDVVSIDANAYNDLSYLDMIPDKRNQEIETQCLISMILDEIYLLDNSDRDLIIDLLFKQKTEREVAKQLNVSHNAVHKRKKKIIKKIRDKFID